MRRFTAVALLFAGMALPACAQRGGGGHGGGFSGHAGGGFHGGFGGSAPSGFSGSRFSGGFSRGYSGAPFAGSRFSASPGLTGRGSFRNAPSFSSSRSGFGAHRGRAPYYGSSRYRRPYGSFYGFPYGYPYYPGWGGWLGSDYLDYPDASGYDDSADSNDYAAQAYDQQPVEQEEPPAWVPYYASPAMLPNPSPAPENENAVTVVFKDGRPSEQIHNYALTRTTLFVMDEHHREIPVDQIDLAATEKVNRDAGINFQLPVVVR